MHMGSFPFVKPPSNVTRILSELVNFATEAAQFTFARYSFNI